jgi:hypothetical protein
MSRAALPSQCRGPAAISIALNFISARSLGLAVAADAQCKPPLEKVPMTAGVEPMNGG